MLYVMVWCCPSVYTDSMSVAQRQSVPPIRALREAHGLGLREAARRAGVDAAFLQRIELGQAQPSVGTLHRLSAVLGPPELERMLRPYARPDDQEKPTRGRRS